KPRVCDNFSPRSSRNLAGIISRLFSSRGCRYSHINKLASPRLLHLPPLHSTRYRLQFTMFHISSFFKYFLYFFLHYKREKKKKPAKGFIIQWLISKILKFLLFKIFYRLPPKSPVPISRPGSRHPGRSGKRGT